MVTLERKTNFGTRPFLDVPQPVEPRFAPTSTSGAVQEAVRSIDSNIIRRVAGAEAGMAYQPVVLLSVVTYCYLHGIYSSEDIEAVMCRDVEFRRICGEEFPRAPLIRRFRRHNRQPLQKCLAQALRWLAAREGQTAVSDTQSAAEASRRIENASLMDTMGFEGE